MNFYTLASKALGVMTAGIIAYDAHKSGTINGTMTAKKNVANTMVDHYVQSNNISKLSTIEANSKKAWFRFVMDNNIKEFFDATVGYIGGFVSNVVDNVVPAALATGTLVCGAKKAPKVGKLCGLGLLLYGAKYMLFNVMSLGKRDYLKENV